MAIVLQSTNSATPSSGTVRVWLSHGEPGCLPLPAPQRCHWLGFVCTLFFSFGGMYGMEAHPLVFFVSTALEEHLGPAWLQYGTGNMGAAGRVSGHRERDRHGEAWGDGAHVPSHPSQICRSAGLGWSDLGRRGEDCALPGSCLWRLHRFISTALHPFWNVAEYKLEINKNRFISTF